MMPASQMIPASELAVGLRIDSTKLPELYVKAVEALQALHRLDEIKEIGNKHSAIAHYAQQAKDKSLMWYAKRVQLRAFERIGEILLEFEDRDERRKVAEQHGVSSVIASRAYDAAHIPKRVRDTLIESTPTPSQARMAESGRGYMPKQYTAGFSRYKQREDTVKVPPDVRARDFATICKEFAEEIAEVCKDAVGGTYTVTQIARAADAEEADLYRSIVMPIMATLGVFKMGLPKGSGRL